MRWSSALAGVGTPWRRPSSTISPARKSTSVPPVRGRCSGPGESRPGASEGPGAGRRGAPVVFVADDRGCRRRRAPPRPRRGPGLSSSASSGRTVETSPTALVTSLRYFHAMMSGRGTDSKPAERGRGDALGQLVGAGRVAADVEDAGHRVAALDDDARLEVLRRQHHRDRVGVGEPAQRGRLVADTVLGADHRHGPGCVPHQVGERGLGLVRLHRQHDDGVVAPVDSCRGVGRGCPDGVPSLGGVEHQPVREDPGQMLAARDQRDVVAGQGQPAADHAADGPGAVQHVGAHSASACSAPRPRRRASRHRR